MGGGSPSLTLRPIRTAQDMSALSRRFKLCIHAIDLYPLISDLGGGEMFHLEWSGEAGPEHAVGWLRLNRTGELHLEELHLPCNEEPPDWLYRRVIAWTNQTSSTFPQGALP